MVRIFTTLIIVLISQSVLPAQVKLLLDYNARTNKYTVSMMPERTWRSPMNKTATGQITLKATTGQFFVKSIENHVPETDWISSGRINSPMESPRYDYIFFRLTTLSGLTEMPYRAFRPTKLFSFTLEAECAREVMLVSNKEDAFLPPNSKNINIGNSIGVLGANGEAYIGNISDLPIFCPYAETPAAVPETDNTTTKIEEEEVEETSPLEENVSQMLYPNPTANEVNITLDWKGIQGKKDIVAYNSAGELVRFFQQDLVAGVNKFTLDVSKFDNGIYTFILVDEQQNLDLGQVIKVQ